MKQHQFKGKITIWKGFIILLSIVVLMACIAVLFPQVRQLMMDSVERILHRKLDSYQMWLNALHSFAMGGICFILFFDYCTLTDSGRALVQKVKQEIKESLLEIDFRSLVKPLLLMIGVYLLGILTIIRANFAFEDDLKRLVEGSRIWYNWSRYVSEFSSIFIHGDTNLTDISPMPQLLAVLILAVSSVLLVYVVGNKKITTVRLLASIPLGLSPYFLGCLVYKFDAPYMALSIFASIFPFLFAAHKKTFFFSSVVSLLIMCMSYQSASGVYPMIVLILCFHEWNNRKKSHKEILSFLGIAAFAFCLTMLIYRVFLMMPHVENYSSTEVLPFSHIVTGTLDNIKNYVSVINHDLGVIWKIGIVLVLFFFLVKSIHQSAQKKLLSLIVSILVIGASFILSYGVYSLLTLPLYYAHALFGFGVFLSIFCIYVVSDYKKIAIVAVLALNWCLFTFAFSYGNALADQARYTEFRLSILLSDLSELHPDADSENISIQLNNMIDYAPSVKNIAKHYPVIERLVPRRLGELKDAWWNIYYFMKYFNNGFTIDALDESGDYPIDFNSLNLPVVLDSYYHTIRSDGNRILIILKH